jgi:acetolactate synthase-1/2/3 large subunit
MNAAQLFVKCLENENVEVIFGLPGEENAAFMMALADSPIKLVLARHEQGAAFMADVYGRLTGKPGVCLGTLGPGATNLTTGVANGNMDRSPMIVITGQADSKRQHKESHQAMDVVGLFEPITKWATPIIHPDNIPEVVRKSFKLAQMEKPGACHIELAEDIAKLPGENTPLPVRRFRRPVPDEKVVGQAVELIRNAKNPVILAGNGAIRNRASKQLRKFVECTGIGVISTFMGKGSVSRHDPNCLFTIGLQAKDRIACAVDASDLIMTIGYDMVEYHPRLWNNGVDKRIVHIDFAPAEVDDHYRVDVEIVGDIAHALWMFNERFAGNDPHPCHSRNWTIREDMQADFAEYKNDDTRGIIKPQKALWDVRDAMGPTDILLSDVGAHKMWIARYYQCDEPNTCLIPNGFCSMGFALPGAIAAKMVYPERKVLAICGDGGFLMNCQEMETATRIGANIVVMVWEDGGYGLISWKQESEYGRHTQLEFGNPEFVKLAESFHWQGMRVENSDDLRPAIEEAFNATKPVLLTIPIDYKENQRLTKRLGDIACPI